MNDRRLGPPRPSCDRGVRGSPWPCVALATVFVVLLATESRSADPSPLGDSLTRYVEEAGRATGVAAAVLTSEGVDVAFAGHSGRRTRDTPTPRTLFEIGSITKVFTGILLADLVESGEVSLETTVGELLPGAPPLDPLVATITLRELATHTSGLPRLPGGLRSLLRFSSRPSDPYRGARKVEIYGALASLGAEDLETRGRQSYSNLGVALLGLLLEEAAGTPYRALLRERVLDPLHLEDTRFTEEVLGDPRLARGHRENLRSASNWRLDDYAPAGGLSSSLEDMVRFLEAVRNAEAGPLAATLDTAWTGEGSARASGLGWVIEELDGERLIWHNGRTGGYWAYVGFLPDRDRGVVVLTNTSHRGDAFASGLLRGTPSIDPPETGWFALLATLGGVALAPLLVLGFRNRTPSGSRSGPPRPPGRIHFLDAVLTAAVLLAVAWKLGAWQAIPGGYWWLGLLLTGVLAIETAPRALRLGWGSPGRRWGNLATTVTCALFAFLLFWAVVRL